MTFHTGVPGLGLFWNIFKARFFIYFFYRPIRTENQTADLKAKLHRRNY